MNEDMESELTKKDSRTDSLTMSKDARVDEDVPIDIRKERKKKAYKETMSQDIEKLTIMKLEQN